MLLVLKEIGDCWILPWTETSDTMIDKYDFFIFNRDKLMKKPWLNMEASEPMLLSPDKLKFRSSNFNFVMYFWILRWM